MKIAPPIFFALQLFDSSSLFEGGGGLAVRLWLLGRPGLGVATTLKTVGSELFWVGGTASLINASFIWKESVSPNTTSVQCRKRHIR